MSTAKTALIIGASRGLGLGLVKTLLADGWQVTATVRNPQNAEALQALGDVRIEKLDMDDQQAVIALNQQLKGEVFDLLFVNAGVKGPEVQTPNGGATLADVGQLFFTNAVAPINLAQRFVGQIRPDTGVLAFMRRAGTGAVQGQQGCAELHDQQFRQPVGRYKTHRIVATSGLGEDRHGR
jgi:NAD(P)-dependent dehydrogenase (short-subunit alcohol dehydrogenase family)